MKLFKATILIGFLTLSITANVMALECRLVCDFMGRCSYVCR